MEKTQSIFHRTQTGQEACQRADSRLPEEYRVVLESVGHVTCFGDVASRLPHRSSTEVLGYLEDLEAIGLIESLPLQWFFELCMLERYQPMPLSPQLST